LGLPEISWSGVVSASCPPADFRAYTPVTPVDSTNGLR